MEILFQGMYMYVLLYSATQATAKEGRSFLWVFRILRVHLSRFTSVWFSLSIIPWDEAQPCRK